MTFLCTYDGKLEPGYIDGHARMVTRDDPVHGVAEFYDWPTPWAWLCDECGRIVPYGCTQDYNAKRPPHKDAVRDMGDGREVCGLCLGWVEPVEQPALF